MIENLKGFEGEGKHWSEIVAEDALFFLEEARKHQNEAPFLHISHLMPPMTPDNPPKNSLIVIL